MYDVYIPHNSDAIIVIIHIYRGREGENMVTRVAIENLNYCARHGTEQCYRSMEP